MEVNMPGAMPGAGAPGQGDAVKQNLSPMNGADRAYMQSRGMMDENQTIADYIQNMYGVPVTAPVSALKQAVAKSIAQASPQGKMSAIAGQQQGRQMPPQGAQMGGGQPRPQMPQQNAIRTSGNAPQGQNQNRLQSLMNAVQG